MAGVAEAAAASAGSAPRLSTDGCLEMRDCSPLQPRPAQRGSALYCSSRPWRRALPPQRPTAMVNERAAEAAVGGEGFGAAAGLPRFVLLLPRGRPGPRGTGGGGLKKLVMEPQPSACAAAGVHALSGGGIGGHAGVAPSGSCDDDSSWTALMRTRPRVLWYLLNLVRCKRNGSEPADQLLCLRGIFRAIARGLGPTTA